MDFLVTWAGFKSDMHLESGKIRYGPNKFSVRQPTFGELYKKQLLSPFTVFQIFCVVLWMLDDYWQYSFFTLFMVLTFEATVVFSRIKSLGALRGMGNKARPVFVYRLDQWIQCETPDLLPGDIMSLTRVKPHFAKDSDNGAAGKKVSKKKVVEDEGGDIIPADLLLLKGSLVVNEASLTGESVPQMKEGLVELDENENFQMKTRHKMSVAYAGTKMLQCKGVAEVAAQQKDENVSYTNIPNPPDDGCVCFVLRTGFASAQGKLVRMIEGSQEKVKGHERETGLLLLLLFVFAVLSSSYVLYHGMHDENRSQYELLLHCILIITSVIPPELPMQTALAVNNSLMTLMRMHIFCTEPYRVPMAGKLDACLFDKTGTLTTDELVAVGVCMPAEIASLQRLGEGNASSSLTTMAKVQASAALVLAGCHSLVNIEGETTGDPLEQAALTSMRWCLSAETGYAIPAPETAKKAAGKEINLQGTNIRNLEILARHHFSSKLQRMSCVVRDVNLGNHYAVAKGSPEAIGRLLADKPAAYDNAAAMLSKEGFRVISLAYKSMKSRSSIEEAQSARASCEEKLTFAGFIAFTCPVRKDTEAVLTRLTEGGMSIAMVTGDALLTAIHVAKDVGIIRALNADPSDASAALLINERNDELRALLEKRRQEKGMATGKTDGGNATAKEFKPILVLDVAENNQNMLFWKSYTDDSEVEAYDAVKIPTLSKTYDLATTGKRLAMALEQDEETRKVLGFIKVFARMTPDAKETVIECLHSVGSLCLMCGDGANDVGALKQADVGVALLSGFGNVNVEKAEEEEAPKKKEEETRLQLSPKFYQEIEQMRKMPLFLVKGKIKSIGVDASKYPELTEKEDLIQLYSIKAKEIAKRKLLGGAGGGKLSKAEQKTKQREELAATQRRVAERTAELEAKGVQWASFKAMRQVMSEEMEKKKRAAGGGGVEGSASALAAQFEDMDSGELPMVKLGDASIAAPFTSKMPSIRGCVDIIRQGRCTLVSSIQMYQILALQCLISSYSLSVLYLDGVKYGDTQMTAMGMLGSVSFMSVNRSKPLDRLSSVRPLTSIFHPALFISLLGQFSIHLSTMMYAVYMAKQHQPPDHEVELDGQFKPGILNTVVFLVSNVQQVTVFVVNLQGRPFMTGLTENRPLLWSLVCTFILTFMFASETVPGLNKYFQLVPFPDDAFRDFILKLLAFDVIATFSLDRLMKFLFCPDILFASVKGTTMKDVFRLGRTFAIIMFLMYNFLGNDEAWEELIRMEEELALNATNITEGIADAAESVAECVGEACEAVKEAVATGAAGAAGHDEF
mmetsp:Transcript_7386/g.21641  ORF Transcript_7386/g.21641 Transcript_7386/m.21641 type:complete len:1311 (+) Transcript_7386:1-3933(+)